MNNYTPNDSYNPPFHPENIPAELKALNRWLPWYAYLKGSKWQKAPAKPTTTPEEWKPFDEVLPRALRGTNRGLGIVTTGYHDLVIFDLDGCIDEKGVVADWAMAIVSALGSYIEVTPSGRGLRIPVGGQIESDVCNHAAGVEIYGGHSARFLTMTGDEFWASTGKVAEADAGVLELLHDQYMVVRNGGEPVDLGEVPELLEEWGVADWESRGLSARTLALLRDGEAGGDGSATLANAARELIAVGYSEVEAFSILVYNGHTWAIAERKRRSDDASLLYLWQHHVTPAKRNTVRVAQVDDFDDVSDEEGAVLRAMQRAENQRLRDAPSQIGEAGTIGPDAAATRFVYLALHDAVFDRVHPRVMLKLGSFRSTFAASKVKVGKRMRPVTEVWMEDRRRLTTESVTFRPGAPEHTRCPKGFQAMNTWVAPKREGEVGDPQAFIDHVGYLFGDRAEEFLDWLAHIEQYPGELPQRCWLHISPSTGTGRNWLASVLCRLWPGFVAPNMELSSLIGGNFNGALSECLLTVIDEVKEGGAGNPWSNAEKFKQAINPEYRQINRKYGIQNFEFNVARWLIFSNHLQAIPLNDDDRRVEVVINDSSPKGAGYYKRLYTHMKDPAFILGVAMFLRERDLSRVDPGARSRSTEAKSRVVEASKSDLECKVSDLVNEWPCDVISAGALAQATGHDVRGLPRVMSEHGCEKSSQRPRLETGGNPQRVWIIRNVEKWRRASSHALKDEIERGGQETF